MFGVVTPEYQTPGPHGIPAVAPLPYVSFVWSCGDQNFFQLTVHTLFVLDGPLPPIS